MQEGEAYPSHFERPALFLSQGVARVWEPSDLDVDCFGPAPPFWTNVSMFRFLPGRFGNLGEFWVQVHQVGRVICGKGRRG